jgi:cellulose synthase/poly-beta-1,6-N-acetylglucosamine synthase-like glycosyltransferase
MASEKRWIASFFIVIFVWFGILFSTIYQWTNGIEVLVDKEFDLSYVTLPLMGIALIYTLSGIFIFVVYFLSFNRVRSRQQQKVDMIEREKEREKQRYIRACRNPAITSKGELPQAAVVREDPLIGVLSFPPPENLKPTESSKDASLGPNPSTNPKQTNFGVVSYNFAVNRTSVDKANDAKVESKTQSDSYQSEQRRHGEDYVTYDDLCSIVIPSRNEESVIRKTIQNCLLQTYRNIEVIVVCHNCTDKTFQEAAQIQDVRVKPFELTTKEAGKGIALNFGVDKAIGKYILILDGDGKLSSEFIEKAMPLFFTDKEIAGVQGRYVPSNRNYNFVTRLLSVEGDLWSTPYMTARSVLNKQVYLGGTGFIIRKDVLIDVGKFNNHLVDDYELSCRLFRSNYKIVFAPLSIDYDEKPPSLSIMLRQRARWAKGFISLLRAKEVKATDVLGSIYWLSPLASFSGILVLAIFGYATMHNVLYDYYPYKYSYIPLNVWFSLIGTVFALQFGVLVKEYGRQGLKYAPFLVLFNPFSLYTFVTYMKALFVKSWGDTKTAHGFVTKGSDNEEKVLTSPD